jgi:hypothetical protein
MLKKTLATIVISISLCSGVLAGEKILKFAWEQDAADLVDLDHWTLYSSLSDTSPFDSWKKEGDVPYASEAAEYSADFTVTAPEGVETSMWFKMIAVDRLGNASAPSDFAIPAPVVIDFKPPIAPITLAGTYDNQAKTVSLSWVADSGDTDIAKYKISSASTVGGPYTEIGESTTLDFVYTVPSGNTGKWMYFVIVAVDNDGNSSANSTELAVKLAMGVPFNLEVQVVVTP